MCLVPHRRLRVGFVGLAILLIPQAVVGDPVGFARLGDGTIVEVRDRTPELLTFRRGDGTPGQIATEEVDGWLSARQADHLVDRILPKVGIKEKHGEIRKELNKLQMAAVPRIVHHLKTGDERKRMEAIAALQFVWSRAAEEAVKAATGDENESIRRIALRLVQTKIPGDHRDLIAAASADEDPHVAGPALASLLSTKPDAGLLAEALGDRGHWAYLHPLLPRYHDRARLGEVTLRMLEAGRPDEQASALCALIHQYDLRESTETTVREFLRNPDASLRMRSAEYLRWLGGPSAAPPLEAALRVETDPHCQAVMKAATTAIGRRRSLFDTTSTGPLPDWAGDFSTASGHALRAWERGPPTSALRTATLDLLRKRPFVPYFVYRGAEDPQPFGAGGRNVEGRYLELVNRASGYPSPGAVWEAGEKWSEQTAPMAKTLLPPTRDYFDPQRHSFGLFAGEDAGPFKNSHHVGDDVAGRRQHETVVAIGDGIVRHARVAAPSWGGLVIIEHRDPQTKQRYCSLYSHLGPLLCVQAGDLIGKGEMLGSLGQDYTLATGGYATHLHFGIHLTPYHDRDIPASRDWITGYLSPKRFKSNDHAWIDPQPFIRERLQ